MLFVFINLNITCIIPIGGDCELPEENILMAQHSAEFYQIVGEITVENRIPARLVCTVCGGVKATKDLFDEIKSLNLSSDPIHPCRCREKSYVVVVELKKTETIEYQSLLSVKVTGAECEAHAEKLAKDLIEKVSRERHDFPIMDKIEFDDAPWELDGASVHTAAQSKKYKETDYTLDVRTDGSVTKR